MLNLGMQEKMKQSVKVEFGFGMGLRKDGSKISLVDAEDCLTKIENHVSAACGGCTTSRTNGIWISPAGERFVEAGATVFTSLPEADYIFMQGTVDFIKNILGQEAVAVTISPGTFAVI